MQRTWLLPALLALLLTGGCISKPKVDLVGTYTNPAGVSLVLAGKTFKLTIGQDVVEGETSNMNDMLWLHPKSLNGMSSEQATSKALREASELGKPTDMELQGTVFNKAAELKISDGGKTLTAQPEPRLKSGAEPFYNALGTLTKG